MAPLLVSGIASLADTVLQTWNRAQDAKAAAATAQKPVDFQALLEKTAASAVAKIVSQPTKPMTPEAVQLKLGGLSEVQDAFNGSLPGQPMTFAISNDGELSRVLPNGGRETIVLSSQSQEAVRQLASANRSGAALAVTLTAQRSLA